ncbi:hypothetical protein ALC60_02880, partial [Trachymyrmex zeteki]
KEKDGGERGVGKGSRVKLKHKGEGGDRGRGEEGVVDHGEAQRRSASAGLRADLSEAPLPLWRT